MTASDKASQATDSAAKAESFAHGGTGTRENEDIDNTKYYYEQAKSISEGFSGSLRPMGTVNFSLFVDTVMSTASEGDMYNISDEFNTNANFKEGAGLTIPAGANIYKTADEMWDILAGSPVTSVNGKRGNVNITPASIGLGNVGNYKSVSTVASQGLSDTEKTNARNNIGASPVAGSSSLTTCLKGNFGTACTKNWDDGSTAISLKNKDIPTGGAVYSFLTNNFYIRKATTFDANVTIPAWNGRPYVQTLNIVRLPSKIALVTAIPMINNDWMMINVVGWTDTSITITSANWYSSELSGTIRFLIFTN